MFDNFKDTVRVLRNGWNALQDRYAILCPYFWRDLKYKISCLFRHRNQWVIDAIPREWRDKDTVFEEVLFAGIINFVEGEKALETIFWKDNHKAKIIEIYNWAKTGRHELEKQINDAYPEIQYFDKHGKWNYNSVKSGDYEKLYGEVDRLEKLLDDTNTKHLGWLIENRKILWT